LVDPIDDELGRRVAPTSLVQLGRVDGGHDTRSSIAVEPKHQGRPQLIAVENAEYDGRSGRDELLDRRLDVGI